MTASRKIVWRLIGIGGIGLLAIFYGPQAFNGIRAGFPEDALHAAALRDCAKVNPNFNRFDQDQRADCYVRNPLLMGSSSGSPNQVDLAVSAARGHQFQTDVIQQQQLARYLDARDAQHDR
jgi:hypothetical protein